MDKFVSLHLDGGSDGDSQIDIRRDQITAYFQFGIGTCIACGPEEQYQVSESIETVRERMSEGWQNERRETVRERPYDAEEKEVAEDRRRLVAFSQDVSRLLGRLDPLMSTGWGDCRWHEFNDALKAWTNVLQ